MLVQVADGRAVPRDGLRAHPLPHASADALPLLVAAAEEAGGGGAPWVLRALAAAAAPAVRRRTLAAAVELPGALELPADVTAGAPGLVLLSRAGSGAGPGGVMCRGGAWARRLLRAARPLQLLHSAAGVRGRRHPYYNTTNPSNFLPLTFDSLPSSVVVLFHLMVVNNWFVIAEAHMRATTPWAAAYFITEAVCCALFAADAALVCWALGGVRAAAAAPWHRVDLICAAVSVAGVVMVAAAPSAARGQGGWAFRYVAAARVARSVRLLAPFANLHRPLTLALQLLPRAKDLGL
eukprot:gene52214-50930_t